MIDESLLPHWKRLMLRKQRRQPNTDRKVVFVGNGPSMKTRMMGETIDKFDIVCRFNYCNLRDYKEYTGSKLTHWFLNNKCKGNTADLSDIIKYNNIKKLDKVYVKAFNRRNTDALKRILMPLTNNIQSLGKYPEHDLLPKRKHPSLGIWGVFHFIEMGFFPVYIIGYDLIDGIGGHYHDNNWIDGHDTKSERKVWEEFINDGKVIRL